MDLSRVLWIGGATDAGKTSIAQAIGERHNLAVYHYDKHDLAHHQELALNDPKIQAYLEASVEERWLNQTPQTLLQRALNAFQYRFPLVQRDLTALLAENQGVIAEGFGLTPELVMPHLPDKQQALWLVPSREFKLASVERRNKAAWRFETSDPDRAKSNFVERDFLLMAYYWEQTIKYEVPCFEVDGTHTLDAMIDRVQTYFDPILQSILD